MNVDKLVVMLEDARFDYGDLPLLGTPRLDSTGVHAPGWMPVVRFGGLTLVSTPERERIGAVITAIERASRRQWTMPARIEGFDDPVVECGFSRALGEHFGFNERTVTPCEA